MAEAAVIGIAKSVLKQLASPAMDEFKLLWNRKTDLENLKHTITTISMVLQDAERQQSSNKVVRVWLERLKATLYDADDFFDTISAKALHYQTKYGSNQEGVKQVVRLPFPRMYNFAFMVKSAHKVKDIRKRLDSIAKDIRDFNFLPIVIEQDQHRRELSHSYFPSDEVVGRKEEREDIVEMLLAPRAEQKGVSVISVIGIGGMGKTTVAQLVYGDDRVQRGFDLHIWACINDFSYLDKVLLILLESINKHKPKILATENLQLKLREQIEGKRFLLVLDDVWDEDPLNWRKLKILLDFGKHGSMVLATTRSGKVAQSMLAVEPYYHLEGISDESAWILFKMIAFNGKHQYNTSRLEGLGQQIVNKCANVPLLIVAIASFLKSQEERKWCSLVDGELPTVVPGDYTKVMQALKISYREFPYSVKRCFAFCSLFPKHHKFDKNELIRLWIAEGFVEDDDEDQSLEDRAEECYFYLADMCFFQKIKVSITTHIFEMHDLVHDLAKEVAGSETFSIDDVSAKKPIKIWDDKIRHVSLTSYYLSSFPHSKCNIRTFLFFDEPRYGATTFLNKVILKFKALRVLDLSKSKIKEVPNSIGKLTHLRFLDLSCNDMEMLPSSICSLHHLQYLSLQCCFHLKELPEEIGRLISMRHLRIDTHILEIPSELTAMTSLVTLDREVLHKQGGELRYLEGLNKLSGTLSIRILETGWKDVIVDAKRASLSKKSRLKQIMFEFKEVEHGEQVEALMVALEPHPNVEHLVIQRFGGSKLPQWISNLDRLVSIRLDNCAVVELPPMSCIRSLKELLLYNMSSLLTIEGNISYNPNIPFFPSLETLALCYLPNLRGWWVKEPTMLPTFPHVIEVYISSCLELEIGCMPLFEPILEVLGLSGVKEEVMWGIVNTCSSALKSLSIHNIRGLSMVGSAQTRKFPNLTSLCVDEYKADESWVHLPTLRELDIPEVTWAIFEGFKSLTSLETLKIGNFSVDGVEEGGATPWEFMQRLHRVGLNFGGSHSMRGVLDGFEHLTNSLKWLTLSNCGDLYLPWTSLLSLRLLESLNIFDVERVIHVGLVRDISSSLRDMTITGGSAEEWLLDMPWMSFTSLVELRLSNIRNLEALPQGIQHLSSLQRLELFNLQKVTSLPCWFSSLSTLNSLSSYFSSEELKKRCEKSTGEDWPLIQHIKYLRID